MKQQKIVLAANLLLLFAITQSAAAADFLIPKAEERGVLIIPKASPHQNLYAVGGIVNILSATGGDLYAAGGRLHLAGPVEQDLTVAGGNLTVAGQVGGDLRMAGGTLELQSSVRGDVVAAGGNVFLFDSASIGGDLVVAGGAVLIESPVAGSLRAVGGRITINSKISGPVTVRANQELVFGPKAEVTGKIVYEGPREAIVKDGAKVSAIEFKPVKAREKNLLGFLAVASLIKLLAVALAAWLLLHFMPRRMKFVVENVHDNFWKNLGLGFVGAVVAPVAIIVALVTVIGAYAAIAVALWYGLALMLSSLATVIMVGAWVLKKLGSPERQLDWQAVIIGALVYGLLWFIPFIGALAGIIIFLATFGGMLRLSKKEIQELG